MEATLTFAVQSDTEHGHRSTRWFDDEEAARACAARKSAAGRYSYTLLTHSTARPRPHFRFLARYRGGVEEGAK